MNHPRHQTNRHRPSSNMRRLLKHPLRLESRLRGHITRRNKLIEAPIPIDNTLHRPSRNKLGYIDILRPWWREERTLHHVRAGGGLVRRSFGVSALDFADDVGDSVGDVVAVWCEVQEE
jgi:hypothetical protein